ncbi:MAG: hypothetical protein GY842_18925 [bacterium]|nr:hypothetical protein [bacterium]
MSGAVPAAWPALAVERPLDAKPIPWWAVVPALVAVPFAPRRLGPRLAVSGWPKAIFAHLLSLLIGTGIAAIATAWINYGFESTPIGWSQLTLGQRLRIPLALPVYSAYLVTEDFGDIYTVFGFVGALHALCWPAALLLMPFIAAGERTRLLYFRCLKLIFWSSACSVPTALFVLAVAWIGTHYGEQLRSIYWLEGLAAVILLGGAWWLCVVLKLGARYAGPPEGPAWEPQTPHCTGCGYILTGLPPDGRCPECSLEIHESTPDAQCTPPWAEAAGGVARIKAYWATIRQVIRAPRFFQRLPLGQQVGTARSFAYTTTVLSGALPALGTAAFCVAEIAGTQERGVVILHTFLTVASIGLGAGLLHFCSTVVGAALAWWSSDADPRSACTASCYASFLFLPTSVFIGLTMGWAVLADRYQIGIASRPIFGVVVADLFGLFLLILIICALGFTLSGFVRTIRAVRSIRYKSA